MVKFTRDNWLLIIVLVFITVSMIVFVYRIYQIENTSPILLSGEWKRMESIGPEAISQSNSPMYYEVHFGGVTIESGEQKTTNSWVSITAFCKCTVKKLWAIKTARPLDNQDLLTYSNPTATGREIKQITVGFEETDPEHERIFLPADITDTFTIYATGGQGWLYQAIIDPTQIPDPYHVQTQ